MTVQLEDLYLKGFMAYNAQDFKSAKAFWEQVVALDPGHTKALQGLEKIRQATEKPKRSSKDVFQDIKKLYSEKKFAEALRLTNLLLKKHPENQDLQSLRVKLEARVKPGAPAAAPADPKRSTMVIAAAAELSVDGGGEKLAAQVERLIQDGVSLYEIQDYEQAIATWKKALSLDPSNRIARDYVLNVSSLMVNEAAAAEAAEAPASSAEASTAAPASAASDPGKPSREKMLEVYNQAMGEFKARRYHEALKIWNYILGYYPSHAETLQCIEKTNAILAKEQGFIEQLAQVHTHIAHLDLSDAEGLLTRLSIEAPHLEGIDGARKALDEARASQRSEPVKSLDLDMFASASATSAKSGAADDENRDDFSATDAEITSFFEPTEKAQAGPRKVVAATPVKKKKTAPVNVFKWIAIALTLAALAGGGFYAYDYIKKRPTMNVVEPVIITDVDWNSEQRVVEDFFNFGNDFEDEGDFLMAFLSFQRAEALGSARLKDLRELEGEKSPEIDYEIQQIGDRVSKSKARIRDTQRKIRGDRVDTGYLELARTEMRRQEYAEAAERLKALLLTDPTSERVRELLGQAYERIAFQRLENDLSGASYHFKCSTVLAASYDLPRRHMEVIQRYFEGDIRKEDKEQWFYFFK